VHRTVRRLAAGLALLTTAGCASTTAGSGTPAAGLAGGPTPTAPAGDPTTAPSGSAGPGTDPTMAGRTVTFGRIRVALTPGTTVRADGGLLCLTAQGDSGCTLEVLDVRAVRAAGGSVSTPDPGAPTGWWWGSDAPSCGDADSNVKVARSTVVETGFRKIGPKTAEYGSWQVSCRDSDLDFEPRLWWLPTSQLAFRARSAMAGRGRAVDLLLAGVTFG
jgi:hypothetical protein